MQASTYVLYVMYVYDCSRDSQPVTSQPQRAPHVSEHRTLAKGPDPSYRVGPNKDLLL